ncbi:nucleoside/nucleotide kinase family protein [Rhodobium gokarnense]|uniref:Pantothenate kinase n=1 Tax=Rhodobium gokarnense TaxID=364296 RepID=A0ABT3HAZ9_9HYPH|nr:nucleoside/nucleotide kinase family protein [Rhodobium gokarnense]MCW2307568.1 pantothenate kinase [Rhodobium gokarnense]
MGLGNTETIAFEDLVERLKTRGGAGGRLLVALAGPPAAGKSTLADRLADALNAAAPESTAVFGLDGYHFDDMVLEARGMRARKGAPDTFDVAGFAHMLARLKANAEEEGIAVPVFDRDLEIARAGARIIPQSVRTLIVEGNYLLLDRPRWRDLAALFDVTVGLDCDLAVLEARLKQRWERLSSAEAAAKIADNDLPNARLVVGESMAPDLRIACDPSSS